jgi:hypothetical protein
MQSTSWRIYNPQAEFRGFTHNCPTRSAAPALARFDPPPPPRALRQCTDPRGDAGGMSPTGTPSIRPAGNVGSSSMTARLFGSTPQRRRSSPRLRSPAADMRWRNAAGSAAWAAASSKAAGHRRSSTAPQRGRPNRCRRNGKRNPAGPMPSASATSTTIGLVPGPPSRKIRVCERVFEEPEEVAEQRICGAKNLRSAGGSIGDQHVEFGGGHVDLVGHEASAGLIVFVHRLP